MRDELGAAWREHGGEAVEAAHEIGAYIGTSIAAHMPDPTGAAQRRGLDIRWMRLKINIPAILIVLIGVWNGQSLMDHMSRAIDRDGILAPVGYLMLFALLLGLLALLPIGGWIAPLVNSLVSTVVSGLLRAVRWGWHVRYVGYLLRLLIAVALWAFALAVLRVTGRGLIHLLTGV